MEKFVQSVQKRKKKVDKGDEPQCISWSTDPGNKINFFKQAKKVGGMKVQSRRMFISSLDGKSDKECAEATFFAIWF